MDTTTQLNVQVQIQSPDIVVFWLKYKKPGDSDWTQFATGTDEDASTDSGHVYTLSPLPINSQLRYQFIISGNSNTAYKCTITVAQNNAPLGSPVVFSGTMPDTGIVRQSTDVTLS